MSNVHIEFVKAATLSVAAVALPTAVASHDLMRAPARRDVMLVVPLQHGTGVHSAMIESSAEFLNLAPLAGAVLQPRTVTPTEDRWLRRAAMRASKLVARGKLIARQA